jgi:hypothetical protein
MEAHFPEVLVESAMSCAKSIYSDLGIRNTMTFDAPVFSGKGCIFFLQFWEPFQRNFQKGITFTMSSIKIIIKFRLRKGISQIKGKNVEFYLNSANVREGGGGIPCSADVSKD